MAKITEAEFVRLVTGIVEDREVIIRHNPVGTPAETLLWMLMSCLVSYLSLAENETPCFTGKPDVKVYRDAIIFILKERRIGDFNPEEHLVKLMG